MLPHHDLGASLYKTWSDEQKEEEISRLVEGYRKGLPIGILCKMTETIAGDPEKANGLLCSLLTLEERETAVSREQGGMRILLQEMLLAEQ
jgi:hypothetical protein